MTEPEWMNHGLGSGFRWEKLAEPEQEDIEFYGEDVEVWELWDNRGEGEIIQTHFITEKEVYCV